ncbi:succinate dehydrogenase/fumarate reductase flavoprotein subunit [Azospirillum fermentarium]|uniref:FAD-dependent oxidoreductase n=1 Tax=Azospirillum fermentarium TaxID=1233114 RepID=UPI0022279CE5|nr:FAD-binding protein [Azospirillum fermentarium]MCW2247920.1 succinate dehydrogenase/fumarate reductase flavoprotein subunit [Azospirillum fermentarium]
MTAPVAHPGPDGVDLVLDTDVLVLGGGPAGTWAALAAREAGAAVILADKGYVGTSGATAPSNTGALYLPDPAQRAALIAKRWPGTHGLADRAWLERTMEISFRRIDQLADKGYPFPVDETGQTYRANLRGPDYMRFMRKLVLEAGVRVLDHSPAQELLVDGEGTVAGAAGYSRQQNQRWRVRAGAVVIATGGCAFLSKALGCNVLTGDGYLMAAEAGAVMSGMEFSSVYGIAAAHASVTKGLPFFWATLTHEDGSPVEPKGDRATTIASAHVSGRTVYAKLDKADEAMRGWLRRSQPNCFLPFDRLGIDPFTQRFPVGLRLEGTVRGTGGIRLTDETCATGVPGLYAAGDAATREEIGGASTGAGGPNASWAIATGALSGAAAAVFARTAGTGRALRAIGGAGLRPSDGGSAIAADEVVRAVQAEMLPPERNLFRTGAGLDASRDRLDGVWTEIAARPLSGDPVRVREAAAMAATARWIVASARQRPETRGINRRTDRPLTDPDQARRILSGGLGRVWARPVPETTVTRSGVPS